MKNLLLVVSLCILTLALSSDVLAQRVFTGKPQYQIKTMRSDTVLGNIVVELFPAIAPITVENFDSLVGIHFFDSTAFHRVVPAWVIQGGDPNSRDGDTSTWGRGDPEQVPIDSEFTALSHRRGILSMARTSDPNSATSQFFICVTNDSILDHRYAAFGQVLSGINIVDKIVSVPTYSNTQRPLDKISMFVTYLGSNDSVPSVPLLFQPANSTVSKATTQTLRWQLVPGAMASGLQISKDPTFSTIFKTVQTNQLTDTAKVTLPTGTTYYWRVNANNGGHVSLNSDPRSLTIGAADVLISESKSFTLGPTYPNPSNSTTTIPVEVKKASIVTLIVSDELGREVLRLAENLSMPTGSHNFEIPSGKLVCGSYICELRTTEGVSRSHFDIE